MYDAELDLGLRVHGGDGIREAFQAIDAGNQDVLGAAILQFGKHAQPALRALILG